MTGAVAGICVHLRSSAVSDRRFSNSFWNVFKNHRELRGMQRKTISLCSRCPPWFNLLYHDPIFQKKLKSHSGRRNWTVAETETVIRTVAGGDQ